MAVQRVESPSATSAAAASHAAVSSSAICCDANAPGCCAAVGIVGHSPLHSPTCVLLVRTECERIRNERGHGDCCTNDTSEPRRTNILIFTGMRDGSIIVYCINRGRDFDSHRAKDSEAAENGMGRHGMAQKNGISEKKTRLAMLRFHDTPVLLLSCHKSETDKRQHYIVSCDSLRIMCVCDANSLQCLRKIQLPRAFERPIQVAYFFRLPQSEKRDDTNGSEVDAYQHRESRKNSGSLHVSDAQDFSTSSSQNENRESRQFRRNKSSNSSSNTEDSNFRISASDTSSNLFNLCASDTIIILFQCGHVAFIRNENIETRQVLPKNQRKKKHTRRSSSSGPAVAFEASWDWDTCVAGVAILDAEGNVHERNSIGLESSQNENTLSRHNSLNQISLGPLLAQMTLSTGLTTKSQSLPSLSNAASNNEDVRSRSSSSSFTASGLHRVVSFVRRVSSDYDTQYLILLLARNTGDFESIDKDETLTNDENGGKCTVAVGGWQIVCFSDNFENVSIVREGGAGEVWKRGRIVYDSESLDREGQSSAFTKLYSVYVWNESKVSFAKENHVEECEISIPKGIRETHYSVKNGIICRAYGDNIDLHDISDASLLWKDSLGSICGIHHQTSQKGYSSESANAHVDITCASILTIKNKRRLVTGDVEGSVFVNNAQIIKNRQGSRCAISALCVYSSKYIAAGSVSGNVVSSEGWQCNVANGNKIAVCSLLSIPGKLIASLADGQVAILYSSPMVHVCSRVYCVLPRHISDNDISYKDVDTNMNASTNTCMSILPPIQVTYNKSQNMLCVLHDASEANIEELHIWDVGMGSLEQIKYGPEAILRAAYFYRLSTSPHTSKVKMNGKAHGIFKDDDHSKSSTCLSLAAHHLWGFDSNLDNLVAKYINLNDRLLVWPGLAINVNHSLVLRSYDWNAVHLREDPSHAIEGTIEMVQLSMTLRESGFEELGAAILKFYAMMLPSTFERYGVPVPPLARYAEAWQDRGRETHSRQAAYALLCSGADILGEAAIQLPWKSTPMEQLSVAVALARWSAGGNDITEKTNEFRKEVALLLHRLLKESPVSPGAAAADVIAESYLDDFEDVLPLLDDIVYLSDEMQTHSMSRSKAQLLQHSVIKATSSPVRQTGKDLSLSESSIVLSSPRRYNNGTSPKSSPLNISSMTHQVSDRTRTEARNDETRSDQIEGEDGSSNTLTAAIVEEIIASRESLSRLLFSIARREPLIFLTHLRSRFRLGRESPQTFLTAIMCLNRLIQNDYDLVKFHLDHVVSVLMAAMATTSTSRRKFLGPAIFTAAHELDRLESCIVFHASTCRFIYGLKISPHLAVYDLSAGQFWKSLELPNEGKDINKLAGYVAVAADIRGDHVVALSKSRNESGFVEFVLLCWVLNSKQWSSILGILEGDRIGCKWYQHIKIKNYHTDDAIRLAWLENNAIAIKRNEEVIQVVMHE